MKRYIDVSTGFEPELVSEDEFSVVWAPPPRVDTSPPRQRRRFNFQPVADPVGPYTEEVGRRILERFAAADAAAEAIDAANAATDAANLAAEAADAATVAAAEARDAADAATAAVEELAQQVATLMAALKAQITTLANTVAKIAKKVRA